MEVLEDATAASGNEPVVLIIDALDEADGSAPGVNPLRLPHSLPKNTYFVVSTRRTDQVLELRVANHRVLELEADSDGNLADVSEFIRGFAERKQMKTVIARMGVSLDDLVKQLITQGEGNFMYLRHVLPAIESGVLPSLEPAVLPKGLQGYYQLHWEKMRGEDLDRFVNVSQPIIAALATSHRPISLQFVSKVTGLKPAMVEWTIEKWNEFLHKVPTGHEVRYRLYHASYRDFLATKVSG
jgi:hypothetical protein